MNKLIKEFYQKSETRESGKSRWFACIYQYTNHYRLNGKYYVITGDDDLCWNDNPIKIEDRIYYDSPERIPKYAKELTAKAFKYIKENLQ